ncbi:hypothetical protein ACPPVT_07375 [Angustibacter sp. McL0619]|uniref:hypothetical protein n=1 Tax=Angustibacter sp. McL0619 TaxID=3415676 RepID=UPI003CE978ED
MRTGADAEPAEPVDLRLLVPALAAWACGAAALALSGAVRVGFGVAMLAGAAALVLAAGRRARRPVRHARHQAGPGLAGAAMVAVSCGLVLVASGVQSWTREIGVRELAAQGAAVLLDGVVVSDPRTIAPTGRADPEVLLRVSVRTVQGRGERRVVRSQVLVFADPSWARVRWGDGVSVRGRLAPAARADDVVATLSARGPPQVTARAGALDRATERIRAGLRRAAAPLPADPRGLLPGLVVGDTSQQPADLAIAMRATGLTHLSAVSGTNARVQDVWQTYSQTPAGGRNELHTTVARPDDRMAEPGADRPGLDGRAT